MVRTSHPSPTPAPAAPHASRPAVFLDRDGVINGMVTHPDFGTIDSPANPDEFVLLPGVGEAIALLNGVGLLVVVVTNQPGIAKGKYTPALLETMERKMLAGVATAGGRVDGIYYCFHHPEAVIPSLRMACACRKPKAGLLLDAARDRGIDLTMSYMVGDGVTDVAAGQAAGATTLFVSSRKCYVCDSLVAHGTWPDFLVRDLPEAAAVIKELEAGNAASVRQFALGCRPGDTASRALTAARADAEPDGSACLAP